MQENEKDTRISDMLDEVSEDAEKAQGMLKMAWVGCMNLADGGHYCFDPSMSDENRIIDEAYGIMILIEECLLKLKLLDEKIEHANKLARKSELRKAPAHDAEKA